MTVLAVDLGTHMGWTLGDAVGPLRWGTFECSPSTDLGTFARSSDAFWREMLPQCDTMAVEKPNTASDSAYFAIRKNMALLTMAHYWKGFYPNVRGPIDEISVMTGKLALAGHGHASKEQMIAAAAAKGYVGMNEHEADSLGIFWVHIFGRPESMAERRTREAQARRASKGKIITP